MPNNQRSTHELTTAR
ncbi:hypothetical protein STRIP9103_01871, partial [Streptomyces ipomoeae 91-03]